jgi:hypothetical protein
MLVFMELPALFLQDNWAYYRVEKYVCREHNFKIAAFLPLRFVGYGK